VNELGRVDYEDVFRVACPAGTSAADILLGFFSSAPKIVRVLMSIRNGLVSVVGLKSDPPVSQLDAFMLRAGSRVGFFEIGSMTANSALFGADDSHLNFRVVLDIENEVLGCRTQVQFNNTAGRVYFFFVKPFHRFIVPMMLRAAMKHVRRASCQGK
jgi:hypothetical protein